MKPGLTKRNSNDEYLTQVPVVRHQANARERHRTHRFQSKLITNFVNDFERFFFLIFSVNSAFISLRQLIPTEPKTRKLSKIETLRLAQSYIEHLVAVLITGKPFIYHISIHSNCSIIFS